MKTIPVESWEEFESQLAVLIDKRKKEMAEGFTVPKFYFRGHSDSEWKLETTLERFKGNNISAIDYYRSIDKVRSEIETTTGRKWEIKDSYAYKKWLEEGGDFWKEFPGYDYMVYLRHHGFPSPLLDWSQSSNIAALFAFSDFSGKAKNVSIYVFQDSNKGFKSWSPNEPHILCRGPYVTSDKRHFLQKCEYTICLIQNDQEWLYICHEQVVAKDEAHQNLLWKFDIPSTERIKVLRKLENYNLNRFSLLGDEDSLMATLAIREFHLGRDLCC